MSIWASLCVCAADIGSVIGSLLWALLDVRVVKGKGWNAYAGLGIALSGDSQVAGAGRVARQPFADGTAVIQSEGAL